MKNTIILIVISLIYNLSLSQTPMVVILHYHQSPFFNDSFSLQIQRPVYESGIRGSLYSNKIISFKKTNKECTTITEYYNLRDTTSTLFLEGFGHEIISIPRDTFEITVNPQESFKIDKIYPSPWMHQFLYSGKNKFIYSLFDSLAFVAGELRWSGDIQFSQARNNIDTFYKMVSNNYSKRLVFLKSYVSRYHIPFNVENIAEAEIYAAYINNLVMPVDGKKITPADLPSFYLETLQKASFKNDNYFFKTILYQRAAYNLGLYRNLTGSIDSLFSNKGFLLIYNYIKNTYSGDIRDNLIVYHLSYFMKAPFIFPAFDSTFADFKTFCKNENYIFYLDSLKSKKENEVKREVSLSEALASAIIDPSGDTAQLKDLFKGKPVVIDCWASWCGPCIRELPFEKEFEKEYSSKVNFIYLSFDRRKTDWIRKYKELKLTNNSYWLPLYFTSDFALHFNINTIPRYYFFDKHGRLKKQTSGIRPSQKEDFRKTLEDLIAEGK
jgi:thiol-disulfide isomerase/thioredoxin